MYTEREIRDLFISTIVIGFIFSLSNLTLPNLIASIVIVAITFVLHELAHRNVARKFGAYAEYRLWPSGLLLALILGIVSGGRVIFAAPGAVYISALKFSRWRSEYTNIKNEEHGVISIAGPLTNLFIALGFLILNSIYPWGFFWMGASINIFIAFFNLLPLPPLDGYKVMRWDRKTWLAIFIVSMIGWIGMSLF